ncbi:unnamed protein product [Closterium sp. NIES-65]|nr:unnamed protein product [Closterium sp. NIES-65]
MPPTTLARLCAVVLALLSVLMTARAQPLAGPRCVNRFPQKPLCKFVDDLAASPLTFLDASRCHNDNSLLAKTPAHSVHLPASSSLLSFFRPLPPFTPLSPPLSLPPPPTRPPGLPNFQKFHRDLPDTKVYAYGVSRSSARYPGPVLVAKRGTTTKVSATAPARREQRGLHGERGTFVCSAPLEEEAAFFESFQSIPCAFVWPFLSVRRAMHRIRMVNAANARTYNLTFQCAGRGDHNFNPPLAGPVLPFYLIGSHGGYLTRPLRRSFLLIVPGTRHDLFLDFNAAPPVAYPKTSIGSDGGYLARPLRRSSLLVVPGTRHDLLLDFNAAPGWCRSVIVVNSASIPFPVGGPADWFTGVVMRFIINQRSPVKPPALPKSLSPADWFAGVVMRIIFDQRSRVNPPALNKPTALLRSLLALPNKLPHVPPVDLSQSVKQRWLTIVFVIDKASQKPSGMLLDGKTYMDPATEKPKVGTSELWHIINPTFETHPIHLHLIQHRPISRRPINSGGLINGTCSLAPSSPFKPSCFTGPARPVPQHERGWKDTTVAWPDSVLTIFVPFKGQDGKPFPFDATKGPGYVWHCHAMEHEDNDMMRPLIMTS